MESSAGLPAGTETTSQSHQSQGVQRQRRKYTHGGRGQRSEKMPASLQAGGREKGSLEAAPAARGGEKLPSLEPLGGRQLPLRLYLFILKC